MLFGSMAINIRTRCYGKSGTRLVLKMNISRQGIKGFIRKIQHRITKLIKMNAILSIFYRLTAILGQSPIIRLELMIIVTIYMKKAPKITLTGTKWSNP